MEYNGKVIQKEFVQAKCECGVEILEVEYWDDEKEFCFCVFRYAPLKFSFKRRLQFLFTGQVEYNEIILNKINAKYIADYINKNINNVKEKEKQ